MFGPDEVNKNLTTTTKPQLVFLFPECETQCLSLNCPFVITAKMRAGPDIYHAQGHVAVILQVSERLEKLQDQGLSLNLV